MKNPFLLKEIRSKDGVLHFKRYGIQTPWFGIYLHFIYKADDEKHMHDHPWNYTSILLRGSYCEQTPKTEYKRYSLENIFPGEIHRHKAEHLHKIRALCVESCMKNYQYNLPVITLFLAGKRRREWGYDVDGTWVDNVTYRKNKREEKYD